MGKKGGRRTTLLTSGFLSTHLPSHPLQHYQTAWEQILNMVFDFDPSKMPCKAFPTNFIHCTKCSRMGTVLSCHRCQKSWCPECGESHFDKEEEEVTTKKYPFKSSHVNNPLAKTSGKKRAYRKKVKARRKRKKKS